MFIRYLLILGAACCALAQRTPGIDPRPGAADYPSRGSNSSVSLGAAIVSGADQHKTLGRDWSGSYVIVEIGLYPEPGQPLSVAPRDFMLRAGTEKVAPVDPEVIVPYPNSHTGPVGPDSKVHVYTSETVGVVTGPNGRRGVYTDSQVGVGAGNPPGYPAPPVQASDPKLELRLALERHELPDIKTANPVAGYLYFSKPKHLAKNATYELDYYAADGQIKIALKQKR
jgi:hypothetical protein